MIGGNNIYDLMDDQFESWSLLVLRPERTADEPIEEWHLGVGNSANIVRIESNTTGTERELLKDLDERCLESQHSSQVTTTIITPFRITMPRLRKRYLETQIDTTFRGLQHLSIEELFFEYFQPNDSKFSRNPQSDWGWLPESPSENSGEKIIRSMWRSLNRMGPLLPRESLTGHPL